MATHVRRAASRTVAVATVLLLSALLVSDPAGAASLIKGKVLGSESVTSGTWAATASPSTLTFTTSTAQSSTVTNTGTIALSGIGYKVTVSNPASGSPSFTIYACAVVWSSGRCSGGSGTKIGTSFAKNSTTTTTSTVVPPLSGSAYLQIAPTGVTSSVTLTLGTTISSATQLRAQVSTNQ
jgi:hypothetical protein